MLALPIDDAKIYPSIESCPYRQPLTTWMSEWNKINQNIKHLLQCFKMQVTKQQLTAKTNV